MVELLIKGYKHSQVPENYHHNAFQKDCPRPSSPSVFFCKFCIVNLVMFAISIYYLFYLRYVVFLDWSLFGQLVRPKLKLFWTSVPILPFFTWRQHHLRCIVNECIIPGSPYFSSWFLKVLMFKLEWLFASINWHFNPQ